MSPRPAARVVLSSGDAPHTEIPRRTHERLFLLLLALLPCMWFAGIWAMGSYLILADVIFLAATIAWIIALLRRSLHRAGSWILWPLALYFGAMVASAAFSADPPASARKLLLEAYVLSLCVVTYHVVRSRALLRTTLLAWIVGTAITAIVGTANVIAFYAGLPLQRDYGSLPAGDYSRVSGLFLNPNMACNYLSIGLLIVLAARRLGWMGARGFRALLVAIAVSSIFNFSPGLGGTALGLGLWFWVDWRGARPARARIALGIGLVGAAAMFVATLVSPTQLARDGFLGAIRGHHLQPSSRLLCWEAALTLTREHPLLGRGTGLPMPCPAYLHVSGEILHLEDAHNSFLNIAALKGIAGLAGFLAIATWLLARAGRWSFASADDLVVTTLAIALVEAFLYQGLSSSFEHTRHLWVLAGLLAAAIEIRVRPPAATAHLPHGTEMASLDTGRNLLKFEGARARSSAG